MKGILVFLIFVLSTVKCTDIFGELLKHFEFLHEKAGRSNVESEANMTVPQIIHKQGYPVEIHQAVTDDGYILQLHRIPNGKKSISYGRSKPIVLLQHGLFSSSADFIILGPEKSLAYILADAGCDVWLSNSRGNFYSRTHISQDPNNYFSSFWSYSWEEMGIYDLPTVVDYILKKSERKSLHYVGHSQGSTIFFVLNSLKPEYNSKFESAHLLAPVALNTKFPTKWVAELALYTSTLYDLGTILGVKELLPRGSLLSYQFIMKYCQAKTLLGRFCEYLLPAYSQIRNRLVYGHFPAGSALKQLAHFGQNIDAKRFQRWDYGVAQKNMAAYGSVKPPEYDLKNVTATLYLYFAERDALVGMKDVYTLANEVRKAIVLKVDDPTFNHFDFCWTDRAKELVYDDIVEFIRNKDIKR